MNAVGFILYWRHFYSPFVIGSLFRRVAHSMTNEKWQMEYSLLHSVLLHACGRVILPIRSMPALSGSQRNGLLSPDFKLAMMVLFGSRRSLSTCDLL